MWCIVLNTVYLAVVEDPKAQTHQRPWVYAGYWAFHLVFCAEMGLLCVVWGVRGYIQGQHYARLLDVALNLLGTISLLPGVYEIETFRAIRVLGAIRVFRSIQGLRILGQAVLHSLPALLDVTLLISFLYFIYGLVGLQTWFGEFRQRCLDCTRLLGAVRSFLHFCVCLCPYVPFLCCLFCSPSKYGRVYLFPGSFVQHEC